jgi:hypothetical protein
MPSEEGHALDVGETLDAPGYSREEEAEKHVAIYGQNE